MPDMRLLPTEPPAPGAVWHDVAGMIVETVQRQGCSTLLNRLM